MTGREISFKTDKYKKPVYLSKRDSIAQMIQNALFMKSGNIPSHPDRYVDIEQYIGKPAESIDELKLLADLKNACGSDLIGDEIQSLTFQTIKYKGKECAILVIQLSIDNTDDLLAISIQKEKNNTIRYQYNFINQDVPI